MAVVVMVGLASCSHGSKRFGDPDGRFHTTDNSADNYVIQFDDYGEYREVAGAPPGQSADTVLEEIRRSAAETNTVVVVFVHGWHHNADPDDEDLVDFGKSLVEIRSVLKTGDTYRASRRTVTNVEGIRVIGVFVGWRGRSLPGPLDFLTFWDRKAAAERVGEGDLRSFMAALQGLYVETNARNARPPGSSPSNDPRPFMGLVSIGHSFGGQALFRAVESTLEQELIEAKARASVVGGEYRPIDGYGDLVVLLNPALEAHQYRRIHALSQSLTFDRRQPPVFMVVSEETDWARSVTFPMGRGLATLFRPRFADADQNTQWLQALGEYEPQRTHRMTIELDNSSRLFTPDLYQECVVVNFDLTSIASIGSVALTRLDGARPFDPFVIAYTDRHALIIDKHSGIFPSRSQRKDAELKLQGFLSDYVAMVEGKRILLRERKDRDCLAPPTIVPDVPAPPLR